MTSTALETLPACRIHGRMTVRPGQTPEQAFCGTWYVCTGLNCRNAHLIPSPGLLAQLDEQRARLAASSAPTAPPQALRMIRATAASSS